MLMTWKYTGMLKEAALAEREDTTLCLAKWASAAMRASSLMKVPQRVMVLFDASGPARAKVEPRRKATALEKSMIK